jgi:ATP-dependent RNA helicase DDX24/MAK5
LKDLSKIQFLVLDEADRMTQEHSFPQMIKILQSIHDANPREEEEESDSEDEDEDEDHENETGRLLGLPGIRGEAHLTMLTDDILNGVESKRGTPQPNPTERSDQELLEEEQNDYDEDMDDDDDKPKVHRQTFIYSATLTLPFTSTDIKKATNPKKKRRRHGVALEGGIAEILEKTRAMGETKVVDLSSADPVAIAGSNSTSGVRLPPGLSLAQIKCTQKHKDSHLYAYLMTTAQGSSGPCLVFCNSIAAVRRVGATLQNLGMSCRVLHAHMQQVRTQNKCWILKRNGIVRNGWR